MHLHEPAVRPEPDERFMAEALRLAARPPRRPWPNPPVGAVVVREGRIVGRGAHHGAGARHAEIVALGEAGEAARGATLYCTLEPCNHQGRTPPCAPAVAESGVARVVVGVSDPNPAVAGGGLALLAARGIATRLGVHAEAALELIWPFVATDAFRRPYVLLKTATSLDGRFWTDPRALGREAGGPVYLSGEAARREVHRLRRWSDLVLVGEGTLRADRPRLDARLAGAGDACPAAEPEAGYVDTDLSYDAGWHRDAYLVFHGIRGGAEAGEARRAALQADGGELLACAERDGHVEPEALLEAAAARDIWTILLEGGPALAAGFLSAGLVDRWLEYRAPLAVGGGVGWPERPFAAPARFGLTRAGRCGPDARLVWDRRPFAATLAALTGRAAAQPDSEE
jgi:diaminohydroxyphosphoribosylaminopyrimidine deaminase/5-amino-6-(5-phosphoribosylamino)uracil reductase